MKESQGVDTEKSDMHSTVVKKLIYLSKHVDAKIHLSKLKTIFQKEHRRFLYQIVTFPLIILYLEVVFHLLIFKKMDMQFIFPVLFALPSGTFLAFITGLFGKRINQTLTWIFTSVLCLIYSVQLVYHYIFKAFLSLYLVGTVGVDALEYKNEILIAICSNLFGILVLLLPLPILGIAIKTTLDLGKKQLGWQAALILCGILLNTLFVIALPVYGKESYSPYDLYHKTWIQEMGIEKLGVLISTKFDIKHLILKDSNILENGLAINDGILEVIVAPVLIKEANVKNPFESINDPIATPFVTITPKPINLSPNVLDIDFNALAEKIGRASCRERVS